MNSPKAAKTSEPTQAMSRATPATWAAQLGARHRAGGEHQRDRDGPSTSDAEHLAQRRTPAGAAG